MPMAFNSHEDAGTGGSGPGAAMLQIAGKLAACGFDVHGPEGEEGRALTVTGLGETICGVMEDDGLVIWEYSPRGDVPDPDKITGRVLWLLADRGPALPRVRRDRPAPGLEVKSLVGQRLKAEGLVVDLDVYQDHVSFHVVAELEVTNPGRTGRGRVKVTDEGDLMWECFYAEDDCDPGAIAVKIADVLAADLADGSIQRGGPAPPPREFAPAGPGGRSGR